MQKIQVFWFRRDLRLKDNRGLYEALLSGKKVLPLFIFDTQILDKLKDPSDARVSFIHSRLEILNQELKSFGSSTWVAQGKPLSIWKQLVEDLNIDSVFTNQDYEPYARERDEALGEFLKQKGIEFRTFKDQVIFEKNEVVKDDGKPYTVFTPYKRKWLSTFQANSLESFPSLDLIIQGKGQLVQNIHHPFPSLSEIGFKKTLIHFPDIHYIPILKNYSQERDFPAKPGTSRISVHLRFGTISIRELVDAGIKGSDTWLSELIWREFYFMILWHFPNVHQSFRPEYDKIPWINSEKDFKKWCDGETGYPLVDAGMRELNETGFMHNRVRMVVASFLTKHLLIDWRWGEAYFAEKLLDFELSSNNGGWQWAAGCGVDAAPYFRIFNPYEQEKRFDPNHEYVKKWVKEWNTNRYPLPMVDHKYARARCLDTYQKALKE